MYVHCLPHGNCLKNINNIIIQFLSTYMNYPVHIYIYCVKDIEAILYILMQTESNKSHSPCFLISSTGI